MKTQPESGRDLIHAAARASERDIAVVGMACRFPQSVNPQSFWNALISKADAISEIPRERWDADAFYDPTPGTPGKMYSRRGAFLRDIDLFDEKFFRVTPREAKSMDPQQRLLLEVSWEALESAGQVHRNLERSATGVFIGISSSEYAMLAGNSGKLDEIDKYFGTGTALSVAAGRISYFLNLRGPSMAIETACSSSLVAVHQAVRSLRSGETDLCIAGGVNVILSPAVGVYFSQLGAVSASSRCKAFDADADGYVRGEGCGIVILKRHKDAERDDDNIIALIRGSAVNHDGRSAGLAAPNGAAQEEVLKAALRDGDVRPEDVAYIEAHGTGTRLGDPIEAKAIGRAYAAADARRNPLLLGSVKTNMGHLEAAAGVAGLIKVCLALRERCIPPQINFQTRNPLIPWDELNLAVASECVSWPADAEPLAAVSSFGFSGTNAHIVLSAAPAGASSAPTPTGSTYLLPVSARSETALSALLRRCDERLAQTPQDSSDSVLAMCRGWALRREHYAHRRCVVGRDAAELRRSMVNSPAVDGGALSPDAAVPARVAFIFSGQGSQWQGMAKEWLRQDTTTAVLLEIDAIVRRKTGWSIVEELSAETPRAQVDVTQVCLFALQVALARRWQQVGLTPNVVVGHSMGEIAAAHIAGALNLEQATELSIVRSQLLASVGGQGQMAVADLPREQAVELARHWQGRVFVAGQNSFSSTIFAGIAEDIEDLIAHLSAESVFCRKLRTEGVASHCPLVASLGKRINERFADLRPQPSHLALVSSVTGLPLSGEQLNAGYWRRNLTEPVRFADAVGHIASTGNEIFVEISPKPILLSSVEQVCQALGKRAIVVPSMRQSEGAVETFSRSLATLYESGVEIDWKAIYPGRGRWEPATTYPWQRQRHWITEIVASETKSPLGTSSTQLPESIWRWDRFGMDSVNMGLLAPWILLSPDRSSAFYLGLSGDIVIAWAYLGDPLDFEHQVSQLASTCERHSLQLALMADESAAQSMQRLSLRSIPVGSMHRLTDLRHFTLSGQGMRRLRNQVQRFERETKGTLAEYTPGSDRSMDAAIVALIGHWQQRVGEPVPAATWIQESLLSGRGLGKRRLFVTCAGDRVVSAVLLTPFGNRAGYLLDMEFYGQKVPPGCNEFAIVRAAQLLAAEGFQELSLGGSYGIEASARSQSAPDRSPRGYAGQRQFKRKFTANEEGIYLYTTQDRATDAAAAFFALLADRDVSGPLQQPRVETSLEAVLGARPSHPFLKHTPRVSADSVSFESTIRSGDPYIGQHCIDQTPVMPGALYIDLMLTAISRARPGTSWALTDLVLLEPLLFGDDIAHRVRIDVLASTATAELVIWSKSSVDPTTPWRRHVSSRATHSSTPPCASPESASGNERWRVIDPEVLYAGLRAAGIEHGPMYRAVRELRLAGTTLEAQLQLPSAAAGDKDGFTLNPVVVDAALQVLAAFAEPGALQPVVLQAVQRICVYRKPTRQCRVRVLARNDDAPGLYSSDVLITTLAGERIATLEGVIARVIRPARSKARSSFHHALYTYELAERALPLARGFDGTCILIGPRSELFDRSAESIAALGGRIKAFTASTRVEAFAELKSLPDSEWSDVSQLLMLPERTPTNGSLPASAYGAFLPDLVRLLGTRSTRAGFRVSLVTNGPDGTQDEQASTADAALGAACGVLQAEHPEYAVTRIELNTRVAAERAARAIAAICSNSADREWWSIGSYTCGVFRIAATVVPPKASWTPRADTTHIVTGWTGGIGTRVVHWLLERGVRALALISRSRGPISVNQEIERATAAAGARIHRFEADIADWQAMQGIFAHLAQHAPPIETIFHVAGQTADTLLFKQMPDEFMTAQHAKIAGTWNLHRASASLSVRAFVMFSSAASLFCPPSQAAHTAASAAMDQIARLRRCAGLPAMSIGWGPWSQIGKAAQMGIGERLSSMGIDPISTDDALEGLDQLMVCDLPQVFLVPVDWNRWRASGGPVAQLPLFSGLATTPEPAAEKGAKVALRDTPATHTVDSVQARIVRCAAQTLMMQPQEIDLGRSLEGIGMDSIMVVELRERLSRELGQSLPLIEFFRAASIASLAPRVFGHLQV
ncbi:MAG TPA: SDR family NAD(P)-dependent oxidoreductase [Steroidobacteraceae bacterium]|nr:SDR family NAD(P)-dependent oxidoreductase [Steroidobacteraceae bacterium]